MITHVCAHYYGEGMAHPLPRFPSKQDFITENKAHAEEVLPQLKEMPIGERWAGIMPFSADGKPIVGQLDEDEDNDQPSLYVCTGMGGSGFCRGPAAGLLLAHFIDRRKSLAKISENEGILDLLRFTDPLRFGKGK